MERYDRDLLGYIRGKTRFKNMYYENDYHFFLFAWYWLIVRRGSMLSLSQFVHTNRNIERPQHRLESWVCQSDDLKVLVAYYDETVRWTKGDRA